MPEPTAKPKTHAEAVKAYESLAKQTSEMAASRPRVQREVERKVKEQMGDFDKKLAELKSRKGAAALEMYAAEIAESAKRDGAADAIKKENAAKELRTIADANAARKSAQDKADKARAASAVAPPL
jgi:hypothetical protein